MDKTPKDLLQIDYTPPKKDWMDPSIDFKAKVSQIDETFSLGDVNKLGYNFGGGLKFNLSRISIRAEVRDHITNLKVDDFLFDPIIGELLGIQFDQNLHNIEISGSVGIRF